VAICSDASRNSAASISAPAQRRSGPKLGVALGISAKASRQGADQKLGGASAGACASRRATAARLTRSCAGISRAPENGGPVKNFEPEICTIQPART
jgi:hypothetical protein